MVKLGYTKSLVLFLLSSRENQVSGRGGPGLQPGRGESTGNTTLPYVAELPVGRHEFQAD